jgi:hypothetical protein
VRLPSRTRQGPASSFSGGGIRVRAAVGVGGVSRRAAGAAGAERAWWAEWGCVRVSAVAAY